MIAIAETSDSTDLAAVLKVLHVAFRAHEGRIDPPSAVYRETAETLAAKLATETLLVAREEDGRVVGCIFYRQDAADEAYIGRLAVVPEQQRRGTASDLVEAGIELARQAVLQRVGLNVRIELAENVRFFERHGFAITREERHPGYDRATNYRMELSLQSGAD